MGSPTSTKIPRPKPSHAPIRLPASDQRVYNGKASEAIEVAVRRPEFAYAVLPAQGRDARVMDLSSGNSSPCENRSQRRPVVCRLGQKHERWRFEPGVHLVESARQGCRRGVDAGMGDDGEKVRIPLRAPLSAPRPGRETANLLGGRRPECSCQRLSSPATFVGQITQLAPGATRFSLQSLALEASAAQLERRARLGLCHNAAKPPLHQRA